MQVLIVGRERRQIAALHEQILYADQVRVHTVVVNSDADLQRICNKYDVIFGLGLLRVEHAAVVRRHLL